MLVEKFPKTILGHVVSYFDWAAVVATTAVVITPVMDIFILSCYLTSFAVSSSDNGIYDGIWKEDLVSRAVCIVFIECLCVHRYLWKYFFKKMNF